MTERLASPRLAPLSIDPTELRVLAALCRQPEGAALELAEAAGLSPSTVAQIKARLRRRGLWRPFYAARYDAPSFGPLVGFWGRAQGPRSGDDFGARLTRLLRDRKVPAVFAWEGSQFAGLSLPGGLANGLDLEVDLLGLREEASGRPVVEWFRMNDFTRDSGRTGILLEYAAFLGGLLPAHLRPAPPPRPAPARRPEEPAPTTPTARKVAAEILANPNRSMEEGAAACGISVSTYAHTKSALVKGGAIERRTRVDLTALGFRFMLLTAIEHRPAAKRGAEPGWLEGSRHSNAPILFLGSSLCSVAITPYRTLEETRLGEEDFRAWAAGQEPLVPPVALCFDRAALRWAAHTELGHPSVTNLLGLPRLPSERTLER